MQGFCDLFGVAGGWNGGFRFRWRCHRLLPGSLAGRKRPIEGPRGVDCRPLDPIQAKAFPVPVALPLPIAWHPCGVQEALPALHHFGKQTTHETKVVLLWLAATRAYSSKISRSNAKAPTREPKTTVPKITTPIINAPTVISLCQIPEATSGYFQRNSYGMSC